MKSEKDLSDKAKGKLGKHFSVQSFENSANQSTPDLYLVEPNKGYSIWVELKIVENGRVSFMPGQCKWLEKHDKHGGLAYVLVLHESGRVALYSASRARWLSTTKNAETEGTARHIACSYNPQLPWHDIVARILEDADNNWGRG